LTGLGTLASFQSVQTLQSVNTPLIKMVINLPRRETAAKKTGDRLEISPLELQGLLQSNDHALSALISNAASWEPFAWKGNDLSAPMRALWVAESRGLLAKRGNRAVDVSIADIAADINAYLVSVGKVPTSQQAVHTNLGKAALYVQAALGVSLVPNKAAMTVRFVDEYETAENIEKYFNEISGKLQKIGSQIKHAESCGYDVSHVLKAAEDKTQVKLLAGTAS
jgi:hypothetical protein